MSYSKPEQTESIKSAIFENEEKPWHRRHKSGCRKFLKKSVHRADRSRKRNDPESDPQYGKYFGTEY